jgi:hypothetical protein
MVLWFISGPSIIFRGNVSKILSIPVLKISLSGELTLEKIAWEGEFTLRSDP